MSLHILTYDSKRLSSELASKLDLLTRHILLDQNKDQLVVNLKLLSSKEMIRLNRDFRSKESDTNVLSFPTSKDIQKISGELGDIAMSMPYIESESHNLNRDLDDHMMHLLAHGILHLLGFDHVADKDANLMETQEIKYLEFFKIANPY